MQAKFADAVPDAAAVAMVTASSRKSECNDNENGARLAVEDINTQGLTIDGHRIELQFDARAAATSPETGTQVANATACGILTKIKRVRPDAIMSGGVNATGELSAKRAVPGSRAKILGGDGVCTDKVGKLAGNASSAEPLLLRGAMPPTGYHPVIGEIASSGKGDLQEGAITFYDFRDGNRAVLDVVNM
ncbi:MULTISPECIES: hypothetical protein [Paraburkholderia]|nr:MULTISPECIES: hypothetical protein [Paraburkholderia]MCX4161078.1 hypothetical protein [Paraburkholderia megapolitana]MDN7156574.1 hypothetical protein [Paraburkholderia sp. CHISQ3]MDQ6493619.1 hypothetical protein [Paraburkholderia megapolitana]QDQ85125.1 hypothetical protein FNZ07_29295 [Paraburkholderia megapolitana]